ncbi:MAG: integrase family protein [Clostridia bacterium]|jgi:integrase|nr:integrase family protein [Clostridia bacterium]
MSIKQRGKNIWLIQVYRGKNKNGTYERTYETFHGLKKEAEAREAEMLAQINNNTFVNKNKMTVEELADEYLENIKSKIALKTYYTYNLYSKNIKRVIGHIKLQNLNTKILEDFYTELKTNTKFAPKTIKHHYTIVNSMLNKAVLWGYISVNSNSKCDKIKVPKKEMKYYNPEQVQNLVKALSSESLKYQALILLAIDSGCRRGELTGLEWSDIDFNESKIIINKETQYVSNVGIIEKETKTESSNRNIYVAPTTLNTLKKYEKEQLTLRLKLGSKWESSNKIFTTDFGGKMHPNTPSAILSKILKKHNLPYINFHGLRHTSISLQIASGIQAQIISKRAGHSNLATTHNIYSHFFDESFRETADKMENFLNVQ